MFVYHTPMKAILILLVAILVGGCSANEMAPDGLVINYTETQCSDPWVRPGTTSAAGWPNDEQRGQAIIKYLRDNKVPSARNVRFVEITPIFNNSGSFSQGIGNAVCAACTCASGRRIDVTINESDWETASKLGFKR